ncbi:MAG: beta-propeller domain-containing protein [Acholeplasmatales bacterium]|nr:beta-propeller domain-containing protein [Acholeplasmatales bacterium]
MKYSKFKKELKNEFNESYNEEKFECVAPVRKHRKIGKGVIILASLAAVVLTLFAVLGINSLVVDNHNARVMAKINEDNKAIQEKEYFKLVSTNSSDINKKKDEYKLMSKIKLPNPIQGCGSGSAAVTMPVSTAVIEPTDSETQDPGSNGLDSYETNNQVTGVNEADIAKFDTHYVYYLSKEYNDYKFIIYDLEGNKIIERDISSIINERTQIEHGCILYASYAPTYFVQNINMQIYQDKIVLYSDYSLSILSFNGSEIKIEYSTDFASIKTTRLIDNYLYIVGQYKYATGLLSNYVYTSETLTSIPNSIYKMLKINLNDLDIKEVDFACNYTSFIYMNKDYIVIPYYLTVKASIEQNRYLYQGYTLLNIYDTNLDPIGSFKVMGSIINQYSIDIKDNYLRVVSTNCSTTAYEVNQLNIFDINKKEKTGCITKNLGLGRETVRSVSFNNNLCYVVTYMTTDPLYEIDLSDPTNPTIVSQLKVPGFSEYTYSFKIGEKDYLLGLGNTDNNKKKISVYEVNNGENKQVGKDYVIAYSYYARILADESDLYVESFNAGLFKQGYKLWFFNYENILYFGVSLTPKDYVIFKIDVNGEDVTTLYKNYVTDNETRLFLFNGVIYVPTPTKLIIENWA